MGGNGWNGTGAESGHVILFVRMTLIAACAFLSATLGLAQTSGHRSKPAAPSAEQSQSAWPLSSLTVAGNRTWTREQILKAAGLRVGQTVSKQAFEEARERLLATGNFRTVGYSYEPNEQKNGYAGRLELTEEEQLYPIGFDSLPATNQELLGVLKASDPLFGDRVPATEPVVQRYIGYLAAYLATKGYHEKITGSLAAESTPELTLLFRPAVRPSIAQVKFTGNKAFRQEELQSAIANVAVGTVYIAPRFQAFLENSVRPVYESRGYVRVAFPKVTMENATDVTGIIVTVQVEEGQVYKLAAVKAPGTPELVKIAALKTGEVFNFNDVSAARQKILQTWRRRGYMRATTSADRQIDDKSKTVTLLLGVESGPRYTFRTLTIKGLDLLSEPAVRKMWGMDEGHPYNVDYPERFLKVVREEGVLDNLGETKADAKVDEETHMVDVTLLFNGTLSEKAKKRREGDREKPPDTDDPQQDTQPFPE